MSAAELPRLEKNNLLGFYQGRNPYITFLTDGRVFFYILEELSPPKKNLHYPLILQYSRHPPSHHHRYYHPQFLV
jgi:hypothetical protein